MHRSSSYYLSSSVAAAAGPSGMAGTMDVDQLPTYNPQSDVAKKEALDASRANLAHTLVHLIPVVLLFCGLLLWSFSTAPTASSIAIEVGAIVEKKGSDYKTVIRLSQLKPKKIGSVHNYWNGSGIMNGVEEIDPIRKARSSMSTGKNNYHVEENSKRRNLRCEM